jgi:hypothetical protein
VQGKPREENGNRRERRPAADQPRGRAHTPPARASESDNNRRANRGANADADAPPLFRRASQNLAAAAMLLRCCQEPATSEEQRVREQLKTLLEAAVAQQAECSASHQCLKCGWAEAPSANGPNPPPPQQQGQGDGVGAATSAVKSRLEPRRDSRHTIEAHRRAESVTTTTTTARTTTTIMGADGATTVTTTASTASHRTSGVHGLLAGASVTRSSPRVFGHRTTYRDTTGTLTPMCGSRTTGSRATPAGRPTISL